MNVWFTFVFPCYNITNECHLRIQKYLHLSYFCITCVLVELVLERHISRSFGRKILWYYMMKKVDTSSYVTAVSVISYMHR